MRKRPERRPFAGWLGAFLFAFALWLLIVQGVAAVLKVIFG